MDKSGLHHTAAESQLGLAGMAAKRSVCSPVFSGFEATNPTILLAMSPLNLGWVKHPWRPAILVFTRIPMLLLMRLLSAKGPLFNDLFTFISINLPNLQNPPGRRLGLTRDHSQMQARC